MIAAKAEIERRGLTYEPRPAAVASSRDTVDATRGPPLDTRMKIVAFVLGLFVLGPLLALVVMSSFKQKGQHRRGSDFFTYAFAGTCVSVVLMIALARSR